MIAVAAVSIVGGAVVAALLTRAGEPATAPMPPAASAPAGPASNVDLSTMTPREAADRLFNRVMSASERGDSGEAARFAPMAVQAYARVTDLDGDAHYHLGLLHKLLGDLDAARAEVARLKAISPTHLLALMLEHDLAVQSGDADAAARARAAFDAAYDAEIGSGLPEYEAHRVTIDRFRAASAATSGAAAPVASAATSGTTAPAPGGQAVFESRCAGCHGRGATGTDHGPPLVHRIYEPGHHADAAFYRAVRQGARAHHWQFGDMPPVPDVSDDQIAGILAYVRGLQRAAGIR